MVAYAVMLLLDCYETLIAPVSVEVGVALLPVAAGGSVVLRRFILKVGPSLDNWPTGPM